MQRWHVRDRDLGQESGFCPAAPTVVDSPTCVRPLNDGLIGLISGRAQIFKTGTVIGDARSDDEYRRLVNKRDISTAIGVQDPQLGEEEVRQPRLLVIPGRPSKKEIEDHCVCHWPFKSWCRRCVRNGACSGQSPSRSRGARQRDGEEWTADDKHEPSLSGVGR